MTDHRNPYLILGVPFGCSADESARAFAVRARGLRRAPGGAERLQELTWASNQVDQIRADERAAAGIYRVPADPGALEPQGPGVLRPPPKSLERRSPSSENQQSSLLRAAAREALGALLQEVAATASLPPR